MIACLDKARQGGLTDARQACYAGRVEGRSRGDDGEGSGAQTDETLLNRSRVRDNRRIDDDGE